MNTPSPQRRVNGHQAAGEVVTPESLHRICDLLVHRMGNDFSCYRRPTIVRRIQKRMKATEMAASEDYVRYLREHIHEQDLLATTLLIKVTSFFRNPQAFEALAAVLSSELLINKRAHDPLRVWVPGCSSGEEAYSLAILLTELMDQQHKVLNLRIFGTDLDANVIDTARKGLFGERIENDVTPERLKRFFTRQSTGLYQVTNPIRDRTIFASHNVLRDPPFHTLDFISCRNLLIYLEKEAQARVLKTFHYSLVTDGILFLGSAESVASTRDLFSALNAKWKIYRREEAPSTNELFFLPTRLSPKLCSQQPNRAAATKGLRTSSKRQPVRIER
jgi:two-component system CheB/CheR fusion protein